MYNSTRGVNGTDHCWTGLLVESQWGSLLFNLFKALIFSRSSCRCLEMVRLINHGRCVGPFAACVVTGVPVGASLVAGSLRMKCHPFLMKSRLSCLVRLKLAEGEGHFQLTLGPFTPHFLPPNPPLTCFWGRVLRWPLWQVWASVSVPEKVNTVDF